MLGAAFLPRWWAHRIGDQVRESIWLGISLGLLYGFAFTLAAIGALRFAFSKRRPIKVWLVWIGVALLLALPNLLTLGIAAGTGHGAHAGQRTLDVQAPGYRGAALAGAIAAALALGLWEWLRLSRHHSKRRIEVLKEKLRSRESGSPPGS